MDKRREQLTEIRDKMQALAEQEQPDPQNVIVGLLLAVYWLAKNHYPSIESLAHDIHRDAQAAWRKANPLDEPLEED